MDDKFLKLKHRFAFGATVSAFFCFTLLVFGPLLLYVTGNDDMWFSFRSLLLPVAVVGVAAFIILTLGLSLVPRGVHKLLCCLTFGVTLGLYFQCAFFNISYGSGVLDGSQIAWRDYTTYGAIDSAMWAACLALPFALYMVFKRSWRHALMITAACLMALQIGTLAINIYQNQNTLNKLSHEVTTEGMYELSEGDNTVVFVLSSMDNSYYQKFKKKNPDIVKSLEGFTEYDNTLATGAGPMVSFPAMLTGDVYKKDIKYTDYISNSWNRSNVFDLLHSHKVDTRVYCDDMYFGNAAVRKVDNVVDRVQDADSYRTIGTTMYRYTLYNCMPHYLKRFFWMSLNDYSSYKSNNTYTPYSDDKFFQGYEENGGFTYTDQYHSAVRIYHLQGAKEPYRLDKDGHRSSKATNLNTQLTGEFRFILMMIEDLKEHGLYENTRIIITADNGEIDLGQNVMLLYKEKGATGEYTVSDQPVSLFDLPATLASTVSSDYRAYGSGIAIADAESSPEDRSRYFYRNAGSNADSRIEEYRCTTSSEDVDQLLLMNNYYINGGNIEKYTLGTELTFTTDETAAVYCKEGFGHTNGWRTIMRGHKAVMEIPIDKIPENIVDLHAYFNVLTIYEKTPCVIYANGAEVFRGDLDSSVRQNGLNFLIPAWAIGSDNTLTLEFTFPLISEKQNTDIIALTSFKIYTQ